MKRIGYLYEKVCSFDNLLLADKKASRGKSRQYGVIEWNKNKLENLISLRKELINKSYKTSNYHIFTIKEPKERTIHRLPYKDRVVQHALMNILGPIFRANLTSNTYSCIPNMGIHKASYNLRVALRERERDLCVKA